MQYLKRRRRMLVDIHVPDFDERFLTSYDPVRMAEFYQRAQLDAVMFYCKSHVGLCNWPTKVGKMHPALKGRDVTRQLLDELQRRDIAACAYHSLIFDNWAWLEHPDWRIEPLDAPGEFGMLGPRYGVCCPNNSDYRAYEHEQVTDLLTRYDFDAVFFDMMFWPAVCGCAHCRERYRKEEAVEIPETLDWTSPAWCSFQSARERWIRDFARTMTDLAKQHQGEVPVYHNFAPSAVDWLAGVPYTLSEEQDFCGGDNYGDEIQQLIWCKQMLHLSRNRPPEFMTSVVGPGLGDHVSLRPEASMQFRAYGNVALDAASLFIDAIDPIGTVNAPVYDLVGRVYANTTPYDPYLGGEPIEDIAIYASGESKVDLLRNDEPIGSSRWGRRTAPHLKAVRGAAVALQQAHLPFGIITRRQLSELERFRLVILPNVVRMGAEEVEAFRDYVAGGGCVYASRYTSLIETRGVRHPDFLLADVFGCHLESEEGAPRSVYLKPVALLASLIAPQHYVSFFPLDDAVAGGLLRLRPGEGSVLATLTLPYAHPKPGRADDRSWASIHSSPPWEETETPLIVGSQYGRGRCTYSAAPLESIDHPAARQLLVGLLRDLLGGPARFEAEAHLAIWVNAFDQPDAGRVQISFLNPLAQSGPLPAFSVRFELRPPAGKRFRALSRVPDRTPSPFEVDADGTLRATVDDLVDFRMLVAEYL
jgi:hypothetical protein